jgi:hypothetical protein
MVSSFATARDGGQEAGLFPRERSRSVVSSPQRKPMLSFRLPGSFAFRYAARTFLALSFHEPPRMTRSADASTSHRLPLDVIVPLRSRPRCGPRASPGPGVGVGYDGMRRIVGTLKLPGVDPAGSIVLICNDAEHRDTLASAIATVRIDREQLPVTTVVSPWFGRDERPPTSGVSPIRRAGRSCSRTRWEVSRPTHSLTTVVTQS